MDGLSVVKFGEVGERAGGSGDAGIPIHRKLEKLRSREPEKPVSDSVGRQFEGTKLSAPGTSVSRGSGVAVGPSSSPHLGKLLLGDGAGSHPAAVHPRLGPAGRPAAGTPGFCFPGSAAGSPTRKRGRRVISARRKLRFDFLPRGCKSPTARGSGPAFCWWPSSAKPWSEEGGGSRPGDPVAFVRPCAPHPSGRLGPSYLYTTAPPPPPQPLVSLAAYYVLSVELGSQGSM